MAHPNWMGQQLETAVPLKICLSLFIGWLWGIITAKKIGGAH